MKLLSLTLPYLLLVTFYSGNLSNFSPEMLTAINGSPYKGVAVPLIGAYDTGKYTMGDFTPSVKRLRAGDAKDVWPWVFFNRFIGHKKGSRSLSEKADNIYFNSIDAIDIYNRAGALDDFYGIWKMSLEIAKQLDSPGIVVDSEAYNNYDIYEISYIAREVGKPEDEVKKRLLEIGKDLARVADETYPGATIWFLFTGLGSPMRSLNPFSEKEYMSVTYIIKGMLEYAKESGSKLKFVSGGMLSLGYCYESLNGLENKIRSRNADFEDPLNMYPNLLLGGSIALWADAKLKKEGYFTKGICGKSKLKDLRDFKPLIKYLFESYRYVWIYTDGTLGYNPYDPKSASDYNMTIGGIIK